MGKLCLLLALAFFCISCTGKKGNDLEKPEDIKAKELLQGVWIDSDNDNPLMYVKGDTIYYADSESVPVYFKIIKDSLYTLGYTPTCYRIDRQTEYSFWFHSLSDNIIKLYKSENLGDTIAFFSNESVKVIPTYSEIIQRDSVVFYNNIRYRAYVYINPSRMKVVKTSYSEDGLSLDNVYYDNVVHLCIYKGKECVYASDITKQMFLEMIPKDFLSGAILADVNFVKVSSSGFLYQANICIPESYICKLMNLVIDFNSKLHISPVE